MPAAAATTRHDPQAAQLGLGARAGRRSTHESLLLRVETERSPPRPNAVAMPILATRHRSSPTPATDCRRFTGCFYGRYWARTGHPQLVEMVQAFAPVRTSSPIPLR